MAGLGGRANRRPPRATNCPLIGVEKGGRLRVFALRRPKPEGYVLVNTTSHAKTPEERGLSPFNLGPVQLYDGSMAKNVENLHQFAKVYRQHIDADGAPTDEYFRWARAGWNDPQPRRYPMGRGAKPEYAFWAGRRLGYIDARAIVYAPHYAAAVVGTASFAWLRRLYDSGVPIGLVDFDGWDHVGQGYTLAEVLRTDRIRMGHAFVLAGLLSGDLFWLGLGPAPALPLTTVEPPKARTLTDQEFEEVMDWLAG